MQLWHLLLGAGGAISLFSLLYIRLSGIRKESIKNRDAHANEVAEEALRRADIERRLEAVEKQLDSVNEGIVRSIQNIEQCVSAMQSRSSEARRELYEKIDNVRKEVSAEVQGNRAEFTQRLDAIALAVAK